MRSVIPPSTRTLCLRSHPTTSRPPPRSREVLVPTLYFHSRSIASAASTVSSDNIHAGCIRIRFHAHNPFKIPWYTLFLTGFNPNQMGAILTEFKAARDILRLDYGYKLAGSRLDRNSSVLVSSRAGMFASFPQRISGKPHTLPFWLSSYMCSEAIPQHTTAYHTIPYHTILYHTTRPRTVSPHMYLPSLLFPDEGPLPGQAPTYT